METDDEGELQSRQKYRIKLHGYALTLMTHASGNALDSAVASARFQ